MKYTILTLLVPGLLAIAGSGTAQAQSATPTTPVGHIGVVVAPCHGSPYYNGFPSWNTQARNYVFQKIGNQYKHLNYSIIVIDRHGLYSTRSQPLPAWCQS